MPGEEAVLLGLAQRVTPGLHLAWHWGSAGPGVLPLLGFVCNIADCFPGAFADCHFTSYACKEFERVIFPCLQGLSRPLVPVGLIRPFQVKALPTPEAVTGNPNNTAGPLLSAFLHDRRTMWHRGWQLQSCNREVRRRCGVTLPSVAQEVLLWQVMPRASHNSMDLGASHSSVLLRDASHASSFAGPGERDDACRGREWRRPRQQGLRPAHLCPLLPTAQGQGPAI